jgi:hypothetical protein
MNVKEIVSIAVLVIIVIVASFGVMLAFFKIFWGDVGIF